MTNNSILPRLYAFIELGKLRISIPVALSALTGYIIYHHVFDLHAFLLFTGVLFAAIGSSALNQCQEWEVDRLMPRTSKRPIPTRRITPLECMLFSASFFINSIVILASFFPPRIYLLTLFSCGWYNFLYTPLKRKTAFAMIPGALSGAIPPIIGWWAAGGETISYSLILIALFFYIGQIPHFFYLTIQYANDYRSAGFPCLLDYFDVKQMYFILSAWIATATGAALLLVFVISIKSYLLWGLLLGYSLFILYQTLLFTLFKKPIKLRRNFIQLNGLYLIVMLILIVDSLLYKI